MRRIIILLLFLPTLCLYSQVKDDFSDGDFTDNPVWQGDSDKFRIDTKKGQLRLNDESRSGLAYLSTPSSLLRETTWTFYVHLLFNSSVNNYALFYLAATTADFNGEQEAYMVAIGGKSDDIILYRQNGKEVIPIIEGVAGRLNLSSPEVWIKVHCTKDGEWTLYSKLVGVDEDYVREGVVTDDNLFVPTHAGLTCVYTSSRSTNFAFDDISIVSDKEGGSTDEPDTPVTPDTPEPEPDIPDPDDTTPPKLLNVSAPTDSTLQLIFDEKINASYAAFSVDAAHREKRRILSEDKKLLTLTLSGKLTDSEKHTLYISRVKDVSGNYMSDSWINFVYYDPALQTVGFGDVVFSEIMANPKGVNDLPEVEYVELYNRTARPVSLNSWKFYYGNKPYRLSDGIIMPESYAVLCHEKHADKWAGYGIPVISVKSFPELANTGKLLWLEDARGNMISWVEYTDSWYRDAFKKKGGFSLECLDTENQSNDSGNWLASNSITGGTPGKENSVKADLPDEAIARIAYAYMTAPDTLNIVFTKPMNTVALAETVHYTIEKGIGSVLRALPVMPQGRSVNLVLSEPLPAGEVLVMELQRLKDISGFDLEGSLSFEIGMPEDALAEEVLFNELLFDPRPDGSDYVELYNNSDKFINLHRLYFSSRDDNGNMKEPAVLTSASRALAPHAYMCFTKDATAVCSQYECAVECLIESAKLPSLPDDAGNISLLSPSGETIDEFRYTAKMHTVLQDDKEGISLEKIYPSDASGNLSDWLSASSACGGGTPGRINSQYREPDNSQVEGFYLEKESFTPDGDGMDDALLISYRFTGDNGMANVKVYDTAGRFVRAIADNYRLAPQGTFIWNGKEENGTLARMGLYLIYIEAYTANGQMKRYKLGCALTR